VFEYFPQYLAREAPDNRESAATTTDLLLK
jgi:hypothetical protein